MLIKKIKKKTKLSFHVRDGEKYCLIPYSRALVHHRSEPKQNTSLFKFDNILIFYIKINL